MVDLLGLPRTMRERWLCLEVTPFKDLSLSLTLFIEASIWSLSLVPFRSLGSSRLAATALALTFIYTSF